MQAGLLNEMIEIFKPEISNNEYGEQIQVYRLVRDTKAQVINQSGNRENTNNEIFYSYRKSFRIRRYIDINETYQIPEEIYKAIMKFGVSAYSYFHEK